MKVTTWNVNGLKSALKKNISQYFSLIDADLYLFQETKTSLNGVLSDIDNLSDYFFFLSPCQNKNGYAGVGILSKIKPIKVIPKLGFEEFDKDGRFLQLDFENVSIINVYMPLGAKDDAHFSFKLEAYEKLITHIAQITDKDVILCGDFNIARDERDLYDYKKFIGHVPFTDIERSKLNKLLDIGLVDSTRQLNDSHGIFTWWSYFLSDRNNNKGMRIDYILVSSEIKDKMKTYQIYKDILISDHAPLCLELDYEIIGERKSNGGSGVYGGLF